MLAAWATLSFCALAVPAAAAANASMAANASATSSALYPVDTVNSTCGTDAGFIQYGQCGGTPEFCDLTQNCQPEFGRCSRPNATLGNPACSWAGVGTSPRCDGRCGKEFNNSVCSSNVSADAFAMYGVYNYGACCSSGGFCGGTSEHCEAAQGCQNGCRGAAASASKASAATTVTVVSTASAASSTATSSGLADHSANESFGGFLALVVSIAGALFVL
ncbi:uncharacterized protein K452DRAFT_300929 [Aplosporella prunicola CBS 121167]|uniref:Chitin-binding type-1 domain-containing protein n=1 Tax=Aplosporella prunicola CBS 121167 TaxID=1176127 RepID=A0A6A6B6L8_9PEZI|nr:uncharacterized protein K452DRAFT_300929 [Aplosporella prunicola CBS 121167]KAF2138874.1 hypothetical protein K452DRAFT_300929 [Aplosporella prunicola CBS 121167]